MSRFDRVVPYMESLFGVNERRCRDAVDSLRTWKLPHLEDELLGLADLDTVTAAVLLVESVDALVGQGVQRTKLMKKLRDARASDQLWSTWAEIRSAAILLGHPSYDVRVELEADASRGKHADFRLHHEDGTASDIEFKAVGLSDAERQWHRHAAEHFNRLLPPVGLATLHGSLDQPVWASVEKRRRAFEGAAQKADTFREQFPAWADIRGICVVGHETEGTYLKRTASRIAKALGQVAASEDAWFGLWWTNGAPVSATKEALRLAEATDNVEGIVSIGQGVAVPWSDISCYVVSTPREEADGMVIDSAVNDELARLVLDRFDSSAGLRPILLRAPGRNGPILLKRDGRRRLFPFNLLFDADPRVLTDRGRPPSPVQDVKLEE